MSGSRVRRWLCRRGLHWGDSWSDSHGIPGLPTDGPVVYMETTTRHMCSGCGRVVDR